MNREIRFRGISVESGEWVYGSLINVDGAKCIVDGKGITKSEFKAIGYYCNEVKPETVGQFCGIKDSNNVDIYEGDIIQYKQSIALNSNQHYNIKTKEVPIMSDFSSFWPIHCLHSCGNIKVVGNIHTK